MLTNLFSPNSTNNKYKHFINFNLEKKKKKKSLNNVIYTQLYKRLFKEIIHPKMKILSLFTHPHVVPKPQDLHSSLEHKVKVGYAFFKNALENWE